MNDESPTDALHQALVQQVESLQAMIEDLQMKVLFQDDTLEALNTVVSTQDQAITELKVQVKYLAEKYRESSTDAGPAPAANERPPHY